VLVFTPDAAAGGCTPAAADTLLFTHTCTLKDWSRVLAGMLEATAAHSSSASGSSSSSGGHVTIPMPAAELPAWEAALEFIHPGSALPALTGVTAFGMLQLADKYDMPCLQGACDHGVQVLTQAGAGRTVHLHAAGLVMAPATTSTSC
jgi:hypothetical protein